MKQKNNPLVVSWREAARMMHIKPQKFWDEFILTNKINVVRYSENDSRTKVAVSELEQFIKQNTFKVRSNK